MKSRLLINIYFHFPKVCSANAYYRFVYTCSDVWWVVKFTKLHWTFLKLGRCKLKDLVGKIACHYTHVNSTMFSGWSNQLNNTEHDRKHQKNSIAANLFSEALDHDKISLNFTQHSPTSTTWWKICAKSVKNSVKVTCQNDISKFLSLLLISDKCVNQICILNLPLSDFGTDQL